MEKQVSELFTNEDAQVKPKPLHRLSTVLVSKAMYSK